MTLLTHRLVARFTLIFGLVAAALLAVLPGAALARERHFPTPIPARHVPAPDITRPALWKVGNGTTTIYLFGTVHALPKGVEWFDGPVAAAFDASDTLVTEIIEKSPEEMRGIVMGKAMLPEGETLRTQLSPAMRAKFEKALRANAMAPESFDRFRPWYAAIALSTLPLMRTGYDPANGVDGKLVARAASLGKGHEALETPEYQLGLFGQLPQPLQIQYLKEVVEGIGTIPHDLKIMIAEWKHGNASRLAKIMNANESDPRLTNILLINRNVNWAEWVKARMARPGTVFVAVGAGHLAGKGSLLDQLKARGLVVHRVQ